MNYKRIYDNIIKYRLETPFTSGYYEKHHIVPHSLGGSDKKDNLVKLSAREHYICHLLLTKIYDEGSVEWIKMVKAFMRMHSLNSNQERFCNNKWYGYLREKFSKAQSINQEGKNNSSYGTVWISNIEQKKCIKINKDELQDYISNGWIKKRIIYWDKYDVIKGELKSKYMSPRRLKQIQGENYKTRKEIYDERKKKCEYYYSLYKKYGFNYIKNNTDYDGTLPNLISSFHHFIPEYNEPNNKRRNYKRDNGRKGTRWIYNLELKQSKAVTDEELDSYLKNGWVLGRKVYFK